MSTNLQCVFCSQQNLLCVNKIYSKKKRKKFKSTKEFNAENVPKRKIWEQDKKKFFEFERI